MADPDLLNRATLLGRILVTHDEDFLLESARCQQVGHAFAGIIHVDQPRATIGRMAQDLELVAKVYDPPDVANRVEYLPL